MIYSTVITSINRVSALIVNHNISKGDVIVVADLKGGDDQNAEVSTLTVERQNELFSKLSRSLPYNHYSRKNIGYCYAISKGAQCIYDTDDDNFPLKTSISINEIARLRLIGGGLQINPLKYFTDEYIWPRGLLPEYYRSKGFDDGDVDISRIGIWQGLANNNPDVDAIYRLAGLPEVVFKENPPVAFRENVFVPTNTQNTFVTRKFFETLYIPSTVSFRFCDILRGWVAQRILWEHNYCLAYFGATVYQDRNPHNLINDLVDEIEMYRNTYDILKLLLDINLPRNSKDQMLCIYNKLLVGNYIHIDEMKSLDEFLDVI